MVFLQLIIGLIPNFNNLCNFGKNLNLAVFLFRIFFSNRLKISCERCFRLNRLEISFLHLLIWKKFAGRWPRKLFKEKNFLSS